MENAAWIWKSSAMSPGRPIQQTQSMFNRDPHCELTRLAHCVCSSDWYSILRLLVSGLRYRGRLSDHVMLPATSGQRFSKRQAVATRVARVRPAPDVMHGAPGGKTVTDAYSESGAFNAGDWLMCDQRHVEVRSRNARCSRSGVGAGRKAAMPGACGTPCCAGPALVCGAGACSLCGGSRRLPTGGK